MNQNRVKEIMEYVKGSPETMDYGRWGALNQEQRKIIKELCNSWLILDDATNKQTEEIERLREENILLRASEPMSKLQEDYGYKAEVERLNNIIKEVREYIEENDNKEPWKSLNGKEVLEILDKGE